MGDLSVPRLLFRPGCPDCAERTVELPAALPPVGDDFDWGARDYDGFRLAMLGELAARAPERSRWAPADLEVVLVEALAAVLDQLSDMLDRVSGEAYLETARRPESVRRLLLFLGYDALRAARADRLVSESATVADLDRLWLQRPDLMDAARQAGPWSIRTQQRMVSVADHATRCEEHPLVRRATAWQEWSGSWTTIRVAVIPREGRRLDEAIDAGDVAVARAFHESRGLPGPDPDRLPTLRQLLDSYVGAYRMAGQEALLLEAARVPLVLALSVQVTSTYYRSEVRAAVAETLGTGPGGFFEHGRLRFGEDVWASDVVQAVMSVEGVENVCLNRFKRLGSQYPDAADTGVIALDNLDIAICNNRPDHPEQGYWRLALHGGVRG